MKSFPVTNSILITALLLLLFSLNAPQALAQSPIVHLSPIGVESDGPTNGTLSYTWDGYRGVYTWSVPAGNFISAAWHVNFSIDTGLHANDVVMVCYRQDGDPNLGDGPYESWYDERSYAYLKPYDGRGTTKTVETIEGVTWLCGARKYTGDGLTVRIGNFWENSMRNDCGQGGSANCPAHVYRWEVMVRAVNNVIVAPTPTPTNTSTATATATNTPTPTNTPTLTLMPTALPTDTSAPTDTPSSTSLPTATDTPTPTPRPAVTPPAYSSSRRYRK